MQKNRYGFYKKIFFVRVTKNLFTIIKTWYKHYLPKTRGQKQ